jgi:hypothetical protein
MTSYDVRRWAAAEFGTPPASSIPEKPSPAFFSPSATMIPIMTMLCVGLMVEALLVVDVVVRNKRSRP